MEYKLDEYGNLINDSGAAQNIFDLAKESHIFRSSSALPTSSASLIFRVRRQSESTNAELIEGLTGWKECGDALIDEWIAGGNEVIAEWETEGEQRLEGSWDEDARKHSFFTPPTPPILPAPPVIPIPPIVPVNCDKVQWNKQKEAVISAWRMQKEQVQSAWKKRIEKTKSAWIAKDKRKW